MVEAGNGQNGARVSFNSRDIFFNDIFNAVQTGLLLIDPETHTILDLNQTASDLIGEERENIIGSVCHRFICPAERGACPITDLRQTINRSERVLLKRDGTRLPIIKSVGYIEIGGRRCLLEHVIDNSGYEQAEARRKESERKTRAIFDQAFQFIGIMSPDGTLTDANRSALKFSGVEEKDVIGKPFWDTPWWTHSAEQQERLKEAIHQAAAGEFVRFEATHKAPDGSLHTIDFSLKPVRDEDGKVVYLIPEGRDITRWKEAQEALMKTNAELISTCGQLATTEKELRESYDELAIKEAKLAAGEKKMRAIFDQTFQFIGIMSPDGRLTDANRSALEFSGIPEKEVIGKPFWDTPWWTHSAEQQERLKEAIHQAAAGEFVRFEATHKAPDGTLHYIDFSLKPVMTQDRTVLYLIPEGRDITDRKLMEDELRQKNEELYAAYEQLTAAEEELRQQYDELARKETAVAASLAEKEVLLREIHHRVKNNLQIIISLLNLQYRNFTDPKVLEAIRETRNRVQAMVLVHEKIYQSANIADIDIKDYIRFFVRYLFELYKTEARTVSFVVDGDAIRVSLNTAVPLSLIINELVSNSLKYAFPDGKSGRIRIGICRKSANVVITISDDGVGIPDGVTPETTGSLGLLLVQGLASQLRADITVNTCGGTVYTLSMPEECIVSR